MCITTYVHHTLIIDLHEHHRLERQQPESLMLPLSCIIISHDVSSGYKDHILEISAKVGSWHWGFHLFYCDHTHQIHPVRSIARASASGLTTRATTDGVDRVLKRITSLGR